MADSAPDPKVEDVLSSVRRLVSGEVQRRTSRPSQAAGEAGALVLTPSHRVSPAARPEPSRRIAKRSLEQRIAELEAAVDRGTQEFEPDGSEDQSEHKPDRIVYTRPPKSDEVSDRAALRLSQIALIETGPAADDAEANAEESVSFRHGSGQGPEAPMARDVPPVRSSGEVRAFSNPDDVVDRIEERIAKGGQGGDAPIAEQSDNDEAPTGHEDSVFREETAGADEDFEDALSEAVAASVSSSSATEKEDHGEPGDFLDQDQILAFVDDTGAEPVDETGSQPREETGAVPAEEKAAETVEETAAEPVGDTGSEPASEPAKAPSHASKPQSEAVEMPDGVASSEKAGAESAPAVAAAALDALPDEEAMRLLVGRLIREELQGRLGERITQNVRKLVRREIMRALESRDLT